MKYLKFLFVGAIALMAWACSDDEENFNEETYDEAYYASHASISSSVSGFTNEDGQATLTLNASAGTTVIKVDCGTDWTVDATTKAGVDWLTTTVDLEAGILTIDAEENTVEEERAAEITFMTAASGIVFATVEITQNAAGAPDVPEEPTDWTASAIYLGRSMFIYDWSAWTYMHFDEYAITLTSPDGLSSVVLCVNAAEGDAPLETIPTGTYTVDNSAKHDVGTFSIKTIDDSEKYYTTMYEDGVEVLVYDGEITIAASGTGYSISAVLLDSADGQHTYSFDGEIEITDDSLGATLTSAFKGAYSTYFASGANQYVITIMVSRAIDESLPYISYFDFTLNTNSGNADAEDIPVGTFTYAEPENDTSLSYSNGILNAQPGTFSSYYGNDPDYSFDPSVTSGTITVSKNSDGTYNFDFDLTIYCEWGYWDYDDNWYGEYVVTDSGTYNYKYTLSNLTPEFDSSYQTEPALDEDVTVTSIMFSSYNSMWWGKRYREDCNAYSFYFQYLNGNYSMYVTVSIEDDFEWEANYASRYCNSPHGYGTFTYSETPEDETNVIVPTSYCYVTNSYTGTKSYINGGSITMTEDGKLTFNNLTSLNETTGDVYTFTGTVSVALGYHTDYSTRDDAYTEVRIPSVK